MEYSESPNPPSKTSKCFLNDAALDAVDKVHCDKKKFFCMFWKKAPGVAKGFVLEMIKVGFERYALKKQKVREVDYFYEKLFNRCF